MKTMFVALPFEDYYPASAEFDNRGAELEAHEELALLFNMSGVVLVANWYESVNDEAIYRVEVRAESLKMELIAYYVENLRSNA